MITTTSNVYTMVAAPMDPMLTLSMAVFYLDCYSKDGKHGDKLLGKIEDLAAWLDVYGFAGIDIEHDFVMRFQALCGHGLSRETLLWMMKNLSEVVS